jgi:inorganic pyrophosphatase
MRLQISKVSSKRPELKNSVRMKKRTSGKSGGTPLKENAIGVVIETPKGSRNKFKYDVNSRRLKLSKVLPEGMVFPFDFGFVPSTKGADGDPLDVLVLMDDPAFPGCLVECRLVGMLEAEQTKGQRKIRNDRLIAVANQSLRYSDIHHLRDLNRTLVKQIEAFFINYQKARKVKVLKWSQAALLKPSATFGGFRGVRLSAHVCITERLLLRPPP